MTKALNFSEAETQIEGLKVALDALNGYFKLFSKAQKPNASHELSSCYGQDLDVILQDFEVNLQGLDILERC